MSPLAKEAASFKSAFVFDPEMQVKLSIKGAGFEQFELCHLGAKFPAELLTESRCKSLRKSFQVDFIQILEFGVARGLCHGQILHPSKIRMRCVNVDFADESTPIRLEVAA